MRSRKIRMLAAASLVSLLLSGCSGASLAGDAQPDRSGLASLMSAMSATSATTPAPATTSAVTDSVVTRIVSMTTPDGTRTAIVHHPASAGDDAPLVVVLHPAATSSAEMEAAFGWDAIADRDHLVVAYPDGLLDGFQDTWNGGRCCAPANELGTDDLGFLDSLVTALRRTDRIGSKVYAVGFSNGAILAYAWACTRPGALVAIGVVAGAVMINCPSPAPLTVVAVHGTADESIPIGGGPGPAGSTFPALTGSLAPFQAAARCPARPVVTTAAPATVSTWTCAGGDRVITDVIRGLDHAWPGAGAGAGATAGPLDATGFLWAHLRAAG